MKMILTKNEYEYARIVADESGKNLEEVIEAMTRARDVFGVSFKDYSRIGLHKHTDKTIKNQGERLGKTQEDTDRHYAAVCEATGRTRAQVQQDLAILNTNPYTTVDIAQYHDLKLYEADRLELEKMLVAIRNRRVTLQQISKMLPKIYAGLATFADIKAPLNELYKNTELTVLQSDIEELRETIEKLDPAILENPKKLRATAADILVCKRLLGFMNFEYLLFGLRDRTFEEKCTYASNAFRMEKVSKVNDRLKGEFFDNKARTYEIFQEFYHREGISIYCDDDFDAFAEFCRKHPIFVKKPLHGAMGSGVGLVRTDENTDLHELFAELRDDMIEFMCEELVVCHPTLRNLNVDSVNTVRLTTYFDGRRTHVLWPWMRIGRSGSFVDNGGAGGITVGVDINTGTIFTDGMDESGNHYRVHPDHGFALKGIQIPDWEGALKLGEALSNKVVESIDGIRYVGWDITYTENNQWVVIEGNTFPQMLHQGSYGKGFRAELDAVIKD